MRSTIVTFLLILTTGVAFLAIPGCDRLSVKKSLDGHEFHLVDQKNSAIIFPESYNGKVLLVGYVYTHCPDICPMITYNMRDVQRALVDENDFMLVSISFDPDRDSPEILNDYANNYRLDQANWGLLTGAKNQIEHLLETLEIATVKTPTRFLDDNTPIYFIDHTDRVTLIDGNGNIRRTYHGSEFDIDRVTEDIRHLLKEKRG
jgi:protein SCO1